ncbi:MAG: XdhC family protein [Deltaproteobacteria bacterium]|nr:XdhC family protein [Deltaproteobacteria bacterium]
MIEKAKEWMGMGNAVALATVIATWGSSPRPVGSQMVIDEKGRFEGSVSGGCIEGAIVEEALDVIDRGIPRRVFYGVTQNEAWEVGLACGGEIDIYVEKVTWESVLKQLTELIIAKRPACLITDLSTGEKKVVSLDDASGLGSLQGELVPYVETIKYSERNMIVDVGGRSMFFHGFHPAPKIIIIGAVHIAKALAKYASIAGYEVMIIDPREAFANALRFPDVPINIEWPDEALKKMDIHSRTAIVTLTHDPKLDDPALAVALRSEAFYIGALGGRKTHAERLGRLKQLGFTDEAVRRIYGPVGLSIGAISPEEIAIAIMAQITGIRRNNDGRKISFHACTSNSNVKGLSQ